MLSQKQLTSMQIHPRSRTPSIEIKSSVDSGEIIKLNGAATEINSRLVGLPDTVPFWSARVPRRTMVRKGGYSGATLFPSMSALAMNHSSCGRRKTRA